MHMSSRLFRRLVTRSLLTTLILVATAAAVQAATPPIAGWRSLLSQYLFPVGGKGAPYDTRFDYQQLWSDEQLIEGKGSARLERIRAELLSVPPSQMNERERLAWALNFWQFCAIERATLKLVYMGKQLVRYRSVQDMKYTDGEFFDAPIVTLEGRTYSLDTFARQWIFADTDSTGPRVKPADPRLMFAISPLATGGPPLLPWPYVADSLEAQLDRAQRIALALPRTVTVDPKAGTLLVSNRFWDYRADFGGTTEGIVAWLAQRGPKDVRKVIQKSKLTKPTRFVAFDWDLNQRDRAKPAPDQAKPPN